MGGATVRNRRLFLDDCAERAALAYERMSKDDRDNTIWTQTVSDTISALDTYRSVLTQVSLDHDLNGRTYVHSDREDCGMEVVRWLVKQKVSDFDGCIFVIHTWNEIAAPKMYNKLKNKGFKVKCQPFGM